MLEVLLEKRFKKDYKLAIRRGCDKAKLKKVVDLLREEEVLPEKYKDHALTDSRNYKGVRECHIEPDWLLIYRVEKELEILRLVRTGTHSDLFRR